MDIWETLPNDVRQAIQDGEEALTCLAKHETPDYWRRIGKAYSLMQQHAMQHANANKPSGRGYNLAWAALADHNPLLRKHDKTERSLAVWLYAEWSPVNGWMNTLPDKERFAINHPRSIQRKYKAAMKAPKGDIAEQIGSLEKHIAAIEVKEAAAMKERNEVLAEHLRGKIRAAKKELMKLKGHDTVKSKADLINECEALQAKLDAALNMKGGLLKPGVPITVLADLIDGAYKHDTMRKLARELMTRADQSEAWDSKGKKKAA